MRRRTGRRFLWIFALPVLWDLSACSLGKESVLFITKTSLGVDVDSKPPTLDLGYSRKEGTLAPQFEEGQVLPQMASFSTNQGMLLNTALGQSFAVGRAAILLSKYLGTDRELVLSAQIPIDELNGDAVEVKGTLTKAKRYFFATDTSFALKVTFGLESGGYPDSMSLGYKRKEFAYVPLFTAAAADGKEIIKMPSLIATAGMYLDASSSREGELRYSQFYATGVAANYLAAKPIVRESIARKILTDEEVDKQLQIVLSQKITKETVGLTSRKQHLITKVQQLSDAAAVELARSPPAFNSDSQSWLVKRDPQNKRLTDAAIAKQVLQGLLSLEKTDVGLKEWEAALAPSQ